MSGRAEGLPQLPDGQFLPPLPTNVAEDHMMKALSERFPDRRATPGRTAVLTQAHNGRAPCHRWSITRLLGRRVFQHLELDVAGRPGNRTEQAYQLDRAFDYL